MVNFILTHLIESHKNLNIVEELPKNLSLTFCLKSFKTNGHLDQHSGPRKQNFSIEFLNQEIWIEDSES